MACGGSVYAIDAGRSPLDNAGSSLRALLAEMQAKAPALMQRHTVVPSWQGSPGYVDVVAKLVAEQLDSLIGVTDTTTVLFSAHGVPVSYVEEAGDPYKRHIEETVAKVTEEFIVKVLVVVNERLEKVTNDRLIWWFDVPQIDPRVILPSSHWKVCKKLIIDKV